MGNGSWRVIAFATPLLLVLWLQTGTVWGQVTASITGTVQDTTGAVVPNTTVTVKNLESGLVRAAETDAHGGYTIPSLPVGQYEVSVEMAGFKKEVRRGITLVVAQQAVVNMTLEVGNVAQQLTVTAEAPLVNTTLSSTSGLVGEKEVKDLPLNGRSFDQLVTLNVGTVNYTSNSGRPANSFSVAGRRPEENRYLINGVDYIGSTSTGLPTGPGSASGSLLGVDAMREFNVMQYSYGVEYGKSAGGQVSIVTSSGTNQLHGGVFEYLRNSKLDARNFYDPGGVPPFKRNQFGGALGGPLKKDKLFLFGNYEGFRQRLGVSSVAVVPDLQARQGLLPCNVITPAPNPCPASGYAPVPSTKPGILPFFALWPAPNQPSLGGGLALNISNPAQQIREDFGLVRFDYNASTKDSLSLNYLNDNGEKSSPAANPLFVTISPQRSHLVGLQETHMFSPTVLNTATFGFSRGDTSQGTPPTVQFPANLSFLAGLPPGTITIGGGIASSVASSITSVPGAINTGNIDNTFTWTDDVHVIRGRHSLTAGIWIQRVRQNSGPPLTGSLGSVSYPNLQAFLQDLPTQFIANVVVTPLGFRMTEAAWYLQDEIKLRSNLTLRLGLRDEMTSGLNESHGRCANYAFDANGTVITDPLVGPSCLQQNNAISLWQPRVGVAWDPTGTGKWTVRAGAGIYNDLQDTAIQRLRGNPPFNERITLTAPLLSFIPINGGIAPPPSCNAQLQAAKQPCSIFAPGGLDPYMHTPTVEQWSLTVEREITKDLMLQLGYVGSEAYHTVLSLDRNTVRPQVCADPAGCVSGGIRAANQTGRVPQGTLYLPSTLGLRPNPFVANTSSWLYAGTASYHSLTASLVKRASRGLSFKANYTFAKALDMNSATSSSLGTNEPQDILNPFDLKKDKGVAAFSVKHQFNASYSYELPFGSGQHWGSGARGLADKLIGGWQWNGILTAQSGFPFTPQVGSNISGSGDTTNPDVPSQNPAFSGPVILGNVNQWFDPHAFLLPTPGTLGNLSRGSFVGPGLTTFDTSLFKKLRLNERWSLQFRAEAFNLFNHANFGSPNPVVFSGSTISTSAGRITTAGFSRQIQFALKLTF